MPRTVLDEGLQNLRSQMLQVAREVEHALLTTLTALKTGEHQMLPPIIAHDFSIDRMCAVTEQQALRLLILQQPLGGPDLRFLTAALFINDHFASMGDTVVQIAETLLQAASLHHRTVQAPSYSIEGSAVDQQGLLTEVFILRGLLLLGKEIQSIFSTTIEAFTLQDVVKARTIENERSFVERRYTPICQDIQQMQASLAGISSQQRDAFLLQRLTSLLWIAHKLAEMATSIAAICKRIIFIVEG
ncbi:MAG TPA: PhoU domain-containing protein [Ktedonobacteraceae bacterium]|jgi:phosphate uptake regulator